MTGKLADYIEKEKIKKKYNEKVKKLCDDFEENLKKDKAQREVRDKAQKEVRYVTTYEYVESSESKRIREENAKEEKNREKASNELPNLLSIVKNDFLIK